MLSLMVPLAGAPGLADRSVGSTPARNGGRPADLAEGTLRDGARSDPLSPPAPHPETAARHSMRGAPLHAGRGYPARGPDRGLGRRRAPDGAAPAERLSTARRSSRARHRGRQRHRGHRPDRSIRHQRARLAGGRARPRGDPVALFDIPGPRVELVSEAGSMPRRTGPWLLRLSLRGGRRPTAHQGARGVAAGVGEAPSLRLGDGSAITAWKGRWSLWQHPIGAVRRPRGRPTCTAAHGGTGRARADRRRRVAARAAGRVRPRSRLAMDGLPARRRSSRQAGSSGSCGA